MINVKLVNILMDVSVKLIPDQGEPYFDHWRSRRLVGKLNYLVLVVFVVTIVSQFSNSPYQTIGM